jgi:hypothetical protein
MLHYSEKKKTSGESLCVKCKMVCDFLVRRNYFCAVCFRSEVLAKGQNYCIGKPCYDKHKAHLAMQQRTQATTHVASSTGVCDAQPSAVQDPWGMHDGCSEQHVFTTSSIAPAGRSASLEFPALMQLPAPDSSQRNRLSDEHLVATLEQLVQEVRSAKEQLLRISDNLETLRSDARKQVRLSHSMEQTSNNTVQMVTPHLLRHQ